VLSLPLLGEAEEAATPANGILTLLISRLIPMPLARAELEALLGWMETTVKSPVLTGSTPLAVPPVWVIPLEAPWWAR
jgi:hypothetical protein